MAALRGLVKETVPIYKKLKTNKYTIPKPSKEEIPTCMCTSAHPCNSDVRACYFYIAYLLRV